jgi:DNA helicase II / ATP-dependent DNA helicase PcrA
VRWRCEVKEVIMPWNDSLLGPALDIAGNDSRIIRVIAGPGTGKTFAMKRRVARLLEEGVDPRRVLAVTFTRVASNNLIKELSDLGVEGCENIWASTLHSFCFSVLMKRDVFEYLERVPRPLISFNKAGVAQFEMAPLLIDLNIQARYGDKRTRTKRIKLFEAAWARLQSDDPGWPSIRVDRNFHADLLAWLKFHNCMLIGELVPLTLEYLRSNPTAEELHSFEYVVVDEYQDLNKAEQELLRLLARNASLFVVGDKNQSIYSFRYAHPEGILEFNHIYPESYNATISECRRCPVNVINIANSLIRYNNIDSEYPELLPLDNSEEGRVYIVQWNTLDEEIREIGDYVDYLLNNENYELGDIIVLSPRRKIGYGIRDSLKEKNIPVHSFYQEELLETEEAQVSFSYLNLLVNIYDRVSLRYLLGEGSDTFLSNQYEKLRSYCEETDSNPWDVMTDIVEEQLKIDGVRRHLKSKYDIIRNRISELNGLGIDELIEELFPSHQQWSEYILEIINQRKEKLEEGEEFEPNDIMNIIKNTVTQPEMPESGDYVRVMSLHKSKGLTSKVVIIAGCIEGFIPTIDNNLSRNERRRNREEQRRLFYVSITRAREILVISSAMRTLRDLAHQMGAVTTGRGRGPYARTVGSTFITELGPHSPQSMTGIDWRNNNYRELL